MSIQQSLDGHSFSAQGLDNAAADDGAVSVELLTAQTVLVPGELFTPTAEAAKALLAANGLSVGGDQRAVWSDPMAAVVAVMGFHADALLQVEDRLGCRARLTTPLLTTPASIDSVVWLHHAAGLLYIKVYANALRFAEVIPAPSEADVVYLIERLSGEFTLAEFELRIAAGNAKVLRKLFTKRFRRIVCE